MDPQGTASNNGIIFRTNLGRENSQKARPATEFQVQQPSREGMLRATTLKKQRSQQNMRHATLISTRRRRSERSRR